MMPCRLVRPHPLGTRAACQVSMSCLESSTWKPQCIDLNSEVARAAVFASSPLRLMISPDPSSLSSAKTPQDTSKLLRLLFLVILNKQRQSEP